MERPRRIHDGEALLLEVRVIGPKNRDTRVAAGFVAVEIPGTPYGEIRVRRDLLWKDR